MTKWRSGIAASSALLLDTHALVWMAIGDARLGRDLRARIADEETQLMLSAVVAWEYADLQGRGRFPHRIDIDTLIEQFALTVLDLPADAWRLAMSLPMVHKDPVDRMLIAHAIMTGLPLASADSRIHEYPVTIVW